MTIWDDMSALDKLEGHRDLRRIRHERFTFDCFNARCRGERVYCAKKQRLGLSKDGTMALVSVLRGHVSGMCQKCPDFSGNGSNPQE